MLMYRNLPMKENAKYWIELADYDYETAQAMLTTKRYLYVAFMCHQVIEKMLKAYWSDQMTEPPLKIHHLSRLAAKSGLAEDLTDDQMDFIDSLEPLNIEARYPSYKERLFKALTPAYCQELLNNTNALRQWIKNKLSK